MPLLFALQTHKSAVGACVQVKNVTGRLLVGLRWWNEGNSETGNAWRFEALGEVRLLCRPSRWQAAAPPPPSPPAAQKVPSCLYMPHAEIATPATMCASNCLQGQRAVNPHEARWFWIVLVANPVLWALCSLSALLGLDWGECVCVHSAAQSTAALLLLHCPHRLYTL